MLTLPLVTVRCIYHVYVRISSLLFHHGGHPVILVDQEPEREERDDQVHQGVKDRPTIIPLLQRFHHSHVVPLADRPMKLPYGKGRFLFSRMPGYYVS